MQFEPRSWYGLSDVELVVEVVYLQPPSYRPLSRTHDYDILIYILEMSIHI